MGIDVTFRNNVNEQINPPLGNLPLELDHDPNHNGVVFEDCLTRLRNVFKRLTPIELFQEVMCYVQSWLEKPGTRIFWLCPDAQNNVPKEKAGEQERRDQFKTSGAKKWHHDCTTCFHAPFAHENQKGACTRLGCHCLKFKGVTYYKKTLTYEQIEKKRKEAEEKEKKNPPVSYPSDAELKEDGLYYGNKMEEKIFVKALFDNRDLRPKLWEFVCRNIVQSKIIPVGKTLIYNYDQSGPWVFTHEKGEHCPHYFHNHGESDLSAPYVYWLFYKYPIYVISIDTDFLAIATAYLHSIPEHFTPKSLIWICHRSKTLEDGTKQHYTEYIDLKTTARKILQYYGFTIQQFMVAILLSGTDYVEKSILSRQFGWELIFSAVQRSNIRQVNLNTLRYYVRWQYTLFLQKEYKDPEPFPETYLRNEIAGRKLEGRLIEYDEYPDENKMKKALDQLQWQLFYWLESWKQNTIHKKTHPDFDIDNYLIQGIHENNELYANMDLSSG